MHPSGNPRRKLVTTIQQHTAHIVKSTLVKISKNGVIFAKQQIFINLLELLKHQFNFKPLYIEEYNWSN